MTRKELLEKRRVDFEVLMALKDPRPKAIAIGADGNYLLMITQSNWEAWNNALDSLEVTLPVIPDGDPLLYSAREVRAHLEWQGFKVKP